MPVIRVIDSATIGSTLAWGIMAAWPGIADGGNGPVPGAAPDILTPTGMREPLKTDQ